MCGALSGVGLLLWYHHVFEPQAMIGSYVIVAAVIGGVTCFTGSMTRNQFSDDRALAQPTAEESKN
ncbi:MAG: hypothetical protein DME57_11585 [Verrucomicrobia bacterium]|nr:MAG: hypothetical protein DME57_11585 [Verrucomicrobiota bacterium]